jgi:uncharacterized protein (TIGR02246 family)
MRTSTFSIALTALAGLFGCQNIPMSGDTTQSVAMALQNWATAFNNCDASAARALYSRQPALWGTVSPTLIISAEAVQQYFERLCSSNQKPKVELQEQRPRQFGDSAVNTGTYTFTVFPGGQERRLPARFSFTYWREDGQWRIVDHHSSLLPMPPQTPISR